MIVKEMNQVGTARWFQGNIFQVVLSSRLAASVGWLSLGETPGGDRAADGQTLHSNLLL